MAPKRTTFADTSEAPIADSPELDAEEIADDPATDEPDAELVDDVFEIPVHGVATVTGTPTGDGRMFATGGLTARDLPLPMRQEVVGTHGGMTSDVEVIGTIDELWMEGNEQRFRGRIQMSAAAGPDTVAGIIDGRYKGVSVEVDDVAIDVSEDRNRLIAQLMGEKDETMMEIMDKLWDGEDLTREEAEQLADEWIGDGTQPLTIFAKARTCGFTIVPIPAFQEGFIALGSEFPDELSTEAKAALVASGCNCAAPSAEDIQANNELFEEIISELPEVRAALVAAAAEMDLDTEDFAPGTHDGPGWITNPRATARIRRYWTHGKGAAKIKWGAPGDFNRCRKQLSKYVQNPDWLAGLCANMHKEAIGVWPGQEDGGRAAHSSGGIVAAAAKLVKVEFTKRVLPSAAFQNPNLQALTPLTVTDDGWVYGHLAAWGSCHIGIDGVCVNPPFSGTDYSYFRVGVVDTEDGEVRVGHLTMGIGHANQYDDVVHATAHYDRDDATIADVAVFEDSFGIAYAGMIRPGTSSDRIADFKANGQLSGDWRYVDPRSNDLELVAAVAVNCGGYAVPRMQLVASGGIQRSLIAAGMVERERPAEELKLTPSVVADIANAAVDQYRHREQQRARVASIKQESATVRALRVQRVKARISAITGKDN